MLDIEKTKLNLSVVHISIHSTVQYGFIFCIILNFRSIWQYSPEFDMFGKLVRVLLGFFVIVGVLCNRKLPSRKAKRCLNVIVIAALYGIIWYMFDPLKSISIIYLILQLLAIIIYSFLIETSIDDTLHKYTNVIIVIAIISLFFWTFGTICRIIKPTGYLYSIWSGSLASYKNYYGIYFEQQKASSSSIVENLIGNRAIFAEGPMVSMVFSIAFLDEFLMQSKLNVKRCFLLLIAVISTLSVTGITMTILAIVFKYILSNGNNWNKIIVKILFVPIVSIIGFVAIYYLVEKKLLTNSGLTRIDDFCAGFKAWMDAPLIGNGYGNSAAFIKYLSSSRIGNTGFSNSIMQILAFGGIYLFLPYAIALGGVVRLFRKHMYNRMFFYLIFFYGFIITICSFQMLTLYLFISMAKECKINYLDSLQSSGKKFFYKRERTSI